MAPAAANHLATAAAASLGTPVQSGTQDLLLFAPCRLGAAAAAAAGSSAAADTAAGMGLDMSLGPALLHSSQTPGWLCILLGPCFQ